jgi:hypothetical protein
MRLANGEMATYLMLAAQALFHQGIERGENKVFKSDVQDRVLSHLRELVPILKSRTTAAFNVEQANDGYARMRCADDDIRKLVALACEDHAKLAKDYPCYEFFPVYRELMKLLTIIKPGYFSLKSYVDLKLPTENATGITEFANRSVKIFCKVLQRSLVKKAQENFERSACDNFEGLLRNIVAIAERYPSAVVLRFETLYRVSNSKPAKNDDEPQIGHVKELISHRTRFHRWLRKRFKADLLLYAWTLEHGRETGLHHHYVAVLKRRGNEGHVELVDEIGMKWASSTCDLGSIYNGNQRRNNHRFRALGLVRMDDPNVITGLQLIASYLTLAGVYVKLRVDMEVDTFGKGGKMGGDYPRRLRKVGRPAKRPLPFPIVISAAQARARYVNFL